VYVIKPENMYLLLHAVEKLLDLTLENCWMLLTLLLGCRMWNVLQNIIGALSKKATFQFIFENTGP